MTQSVFSRASSSVAGCSGEQAALSAAPTVSTDSADACGVDLSDQELLSAALREAVDAHRTGVIAGPVVDEVALRRAERRARRADAARLLQQSGSGDVA